MSSGDSVCSGNDRRDLSRTGQNQEPPRGVGGTEEALTPDVMMTDWKRSKTGLMASEASMQLWEADQGGEGQAGGGAQGPLVPSGLGAHLKCRMGLAMVGVLSSKGSMMMVKPAGGGESAGCQG